MKCPLPACSPPVAEAHWPGCKTGCKKGKHSFIFFPFDSKSSFAICTNCNLHQVHKLPARVRGGRASAKMRGCESGRARARSVRRAASCCVVRQLLASHGVRHSRVDGQIGQRRSLVCEAVVQPAGGLGVPSTLQDKGEGAAPEDTRQSPL